jgi:hypothetical protein
LGRRNITHDFPEDLFEYYNLNIKKYMDICRKWFGVKKRDDVKELIKRQELEYRSYWLNGSLLIRKKYF